MSFVSLPEHRNPPAVANSTYCTSRSHHGGCFFLNNATALGMKALHRPNLWCMEIMRHTGRFTIASQSWAPMKRKAAIDTESRQWANSIKAALWSNISYYYLLTVCGIARCKYLKTSFLMLTLKGGSSDCLPEQCAFLTLWTCDATKRLLLLFYNTFTVGGSQFYDTDKVQCTFTDVVVDLVSRGAGDEPLTDITPRCIHAALVRLAGTCGQTLVYVYRLEKKRNCGKMCHFEERG